MEVKLTKKTILDFVSVVLGVFLFVALFVPLFNVVVKIDGYSETESVSLFSGKVGNFGFTVKEYFNDACEREIGNFFYVLAKISAFVAIIAGIALAVFAVFSILGKEFKILGMEFSQFKKILAFVALGAAAAIFLFAILMFFVSTKSIYGLKYFMSGAIGWYFIFICAGASGAITVFLNKD